MHWQVDGGAGVIAPGRAAWGRTSSPRRGTAWRRVVARAEPVLEVELVRGRERRGRADAEAGRGRNLDGPSRICSGCSVRPWPSCQIQCVSSAVISPGRGGADVGEHRQRDVEVVVGVRAPGQPEVVAELGDPDRAGHGPEVRVGERDVDGVGAYGVGHLRASRWRSCWWRCAARWRRLNSAITSRPEKPPSAPQGSSAYARTSSHAAAAGGPRRRAASRRWGRG